MRSTRHVVLGWLVFLGAARLAAQTFLPFNLNNVTTTLYMGDGTTIDTTTTYYQDVQVFYSSGTTVEGVMADFGTMASAGTPAYNLSGEITLWNRSGVTELDLNLFSGDVVNRKNLDRVVIGGLFPQDSNYQLNGIGWNSTVQEGTFEGGPIYYNSFTPFTLGRDFSFDGDAGTLTFDPQLDAAFPMNLYVVAVLTATEVSAVPEPAVAALLLSLGAAGYMGWRRRTAIATARAS